MASKTGTETIKDKEKVLLVVIDQKKRDSGWTTDKVYEEMVELVVACGGEVIDSIVCKVIKPNASIFITEGRAKDIANLSQMKEIDTVIFSHDLKGSQQRNLEEIIKSKTIDRTQLILDIFAKHATSQEGKMQVELAQLEYLLPRLVGKGLELSRLGGGIGTLGPGETKLEVDRRRISQRIGKLKKSLQGVTSNRSLKRKKRKDQGIPMISLVGYTNAGKSSLLNILTEAKQITKDGLFTTLDSLSRQLILANHQKVILSDTVGFMHELPHHLIEAFKATLEEVQEADMLLHVLDVSDPNFRDLHLSVLSVLEELEIKDKTVITVFNKIDRFSERVWLKDLEENFEQAIGVSAKTGENLDDLKTMIQELNANKFVEIDVMIPIERMDLVNLAHQQGQVFSVKYYNDKINIRAAIPTKIRSNFTKSSN